MVRGLLETCGPITTAAVAAGIGITVSQADAALESLEGEGILLRGKFTPGRSNLAETTQQPMEWCHRRLLSRIHRLTMDGLRRQIEPVTVDVFMRFLFRHHGIIESHRREGSNGLFEAIGQLQGLDLPSVAWERDILPLRVTGYHSEWLDELCLTGEVGWMRLFPPPRIPDKSRPMASLTRVAPVSLFLREDLPWLAAQRRFRITKGSVVPPGNFWKS